MKATTVEHAPPISLFVERNAKGAFRFPACERCNVGSRLNDQVAAASLLIMGAATASHVKQEYLNKLLDGVASNSPDFIRAIGGIERSETLRINGLLRELDIVSVDREVFQRWLNPWAAKQCLAFWFQETGEILSERGAVFVHWITNEGVTGHDRFFSKLSEMGLSVQEMRQGGISYAEQFQYYFGKTAERDIGTFLFSYHNSAAVWGGVFEDYNVAMRYNRLPIYRTDAGSGIYQFSSPTNIEL